VAGKDLTERDLSFVLLAPPVVQQENITNIYIELRKKRSASLPEFPYRRENGEGAGCVLL
jgi:hypothetical protein